MIFEKKLRDNIEGLKSYYTKIGDFNIHNVEAGKGKPVILIHGANIGWGQWHRNIGELAKYFKVYAIDLPGAGGSSRIDFGSMNPNSAFVDTVLSFIKQKNIQGTHIVGHSVGGWVGMKLAIDNPQEIGRLVLVNSLGFSDYVPWGYRPVSFTIGANILSKTVMSPTRDNMRSFLADVLYNKEVLTEQLVDYFHEAVNSGKVSHPFALINRLFKPLKIRDEFVMKDDLAKISAETLIISSDKDPLIPLHKQEAHFSLIPNSRVEIFKDTGHVPPMERSKEFNKLLVNFLSK